MSSLRHKRRLRHCDPRRSDRSRGNVDLADSVGVVRVSGKLVLLGLIGTHAHVYQYVTGRFGLDPDTVGVRSGVADVRRATKKRSGVPSASSPK